MNKPFRIARIDHDVYFAELLPSDRRSPRALAALAGKTLLERYPGFSRETVFDFSVVPTRGKRWLMVTAMERRELVGYRNAAPFRRLATATSAIVRDRRFLDLPVSRYGDELVGYDAERDEPVSLPLTERDAGLPEGSVDIGKAACRFRAAVFPRPSRRARLRAFPYAVAALAVTLIAVASLVCAGFGNPGGSPASLTDTGLTAGLSGNEGESVSFPGGCRALVDISSALLSARGSLDSYSYDETADRPVRVEVRGCDPLELASALSRIAYLSKPEYGRIEYDGSVPRFEIAFAAVDGVRFPTARDGSAAPADEAFLSVIRGQRLRAAHIDRDGSNGFSLGIGAGKMAASMKTVLSSIERTGAMVSAVSVRVLRSERAFDVACSIAMNRAPGSAPSEIEWARVVDAAGFPDVARADAARIVGAEFDGGIADSGMSAGAGRIGKIIDRDGMTMSFVKGADGKISMREE